MTEEIMMRHAKTPICPECRERPVAIGTETCLCLPPRREVRFYMDKCRECFVLSIERSAAGKEGTLDREGSTAECAAE